MLDDVLSLLACPHCGQGLDRRDTTLRCPENHSFDIARHGYVSLLAGGGATASGDSAEMVAARSRFLDAGHYNPLRQAVAQRVNLRGAGRVLDVGAGPGHYLSTVLEQSPHAVGLAVDASRAAARRAAHAHPRAGSVVANTWQQLPVHSGCIDVAMTVFAPRQADELRRVLRRDGSLFVLTPTVRHLRELIGPLQLLHVDERKPGRLEEAMGGHFTRIHTDELEFPLTLGTDDLVALVGMGPSAWHASAELRAERIAALPVPMMVTASVLMSEYRVKP